jgi:uncharacterized protein (DUF58 family)
MELTRLLARVKNLEIVSTRLVDSLLSGNYRTAFLGPGLEFAEVRAYAEGDDPRAMDWNVTARSHEAFVKTFHDEREVNLFLLVDQSASVAARRGASQIRDAADLVFSLFAMAAVNNGDRVGACFFTDRIERWVPPRRGRRHALRLLADFEDIRPAGSGSDLALALRASGESLKRRGVVVILSDFKTAGYLKDLAALARRHDVIAIRLVPVEDLAFPHVGMVHMEDVETGRIINGYGNSHSFRRAFRDHWLNQRRAWFRDLRRMGVSTLELRGDEDPVVRLSQFFHRRRTRR